MAAPRRTAMRTNPPMASSSTTTLPGPTSHHQSPHIHIPPSSTLRLRAEPGPSQETPTQQDRRIHWAEDVVNNEGMGKKSSKVCCIYHKPRPVGESSDESSSDSSSDEDSDAAPDDGSAKPPGVNRAARHHNHDHDNGQGHACDSGAEGASKANNKAHRRATNAYETVPKNT